MNWAVDNLESHRHIVRLAARREHLVIPFANYGQAHERCLDGNTPGEEREIWRRKRSAAALELMNAIYD
jgi:hypothetical protein